MCVCLCARALRNVSACPTYPQVKIQRTLCVFLQNLAVDTSVGAAFTKRPDASHFLFCGISGVTKITHISRICVGVDYLVDGFTVKTYLIVSTHQKLAGFKEKNGAKEGGGVCVHTGILTSDWLPTAHAWIAVL